MRGKGIMALLSILNFIFNKHHKRNFPKILFICKTRFTSGGEILNAPIAMSTGLFNSANHIVKMLQHMGIEANIAEVIDNNSIDKVVTHYRPDIVIIEALWVVPDKFDILMKLHPTVKWIVRIHSKIPFLSLEGSALNWMYKYMNKPNVYLGVNSNIMIRDLMRFFPSHRLFYLPNYYMIDDDKQSTIEIRFQDIINIGCFGAIRPLKNQLMQAMAAINFGNITHNRIHFYINVGRVEGFQSQNILRNIRALFDNNPKHELIECDWLSMPDFLRLLRSIDLGMQVSLSESFNLVVADMVTRNIPTIVSNEISWMPDECKVDNSISSITQGLMMIQRHRHRVVRRSQAALDIFNQSSQEAWIEFLTSDRFS
jgi:hypothetical protein